MIHIEENKLTITIEQHFIEDFYASTVVELIDLIYSQDDDMLQTNRHVLTLLKEMMPDMAQIKAMRGVEADTNN